MSYLVLARKYRPNDFREVVGQAHVVTTLSNAIKARRLSHAYLFAGPKGSGKTTVARILAKCLNCEEGLSPIPCNRCSVCMEITRGNSVDVVEIDGASNRGIDEIRALREEVRFLPAKSRYKIYIIDEVHMLTEPAFNALLKTLEEPPSHVIFIFATTDPFRIPPTILSRTQRFDFRPLTSKEIGSYLRELAKRESVRIEEEAIDFIARRSEGSMRDALTILDQLIAYSPNNIRAKDVLALVGAIPIERLLEISSAIQSKSLKEALNIINNLVDEGIDLSHFVKELLTHFRNLLLVFFDEELVEFSKEELSLLKEQAKRFTSARLLEVIEELANVVKEMRQSSCPRILFEMSIIRLTVEDNRPSLERIYQEILDLEREFYPAEKASQIKKVPLGVNLEKIKQIWPEILKTVKVKSPTFASCLEEAKLIKVDNKELVIGFPSTFHYETCKRAKNKEEVEDELEKMIGERLKVKAILLEEKREKSLDGFLEMEPMVKKVVEIFGGEIKEVNPRGG